jgi:4-diphosphocytidyl-2C-methyl-D-erythritol kinase
VLAKLWELVRREELIVIAARLGADVPFFFYGAQRAQRASATRLKPSTTSSNLCLSQMHSTADAYRALDERSLTSLISETILSSSQPTADSDKIDLANLINDEAVVFDLKPEIRRAK